MGALEGVVPPLPVLIFPGSAVSPNLVAPGPRRELPGVVEDALQLRRFVLRFPGVVFCWVVRLQSEVPKGLSDGGRLPLWVIIVVAEV